MPVVLEILLQFLLTYVVVDYPHLLSSASVRLVLPHYGSWFYELLLWLLVDAIYHITLLDIGVSEFTSYFEVSYEVVVGEEDGVVLEGYGQLLVAGKEKVYFPRRDFVTEFQLFLWRLAEISSFVAFKTEMDPDVVIWNVVGIGELLLDPTVAHPTTIFNLFLK